VLKNDGNAETNISVNFTNLWDSIANPNKYFQYKVRSPLTGCAISQGTTTEWTNASAYGVLTSLINRLNFTSGYQTGCDNVSIDLNLEVPPKESAGNKSAIITFIGSLGEPRLSE